VLTLASFLLGGCFNVAGQVKERKSALRVLDTTDHQQSPVADSTRVKLEVRFIDDEMHVTATESQQCKRRRVETYKQFDVITQHLPASHWWTLGSGALLAGAGTAGILMGSDLNPPGETGALMSPSEAEDRDTGRVMLPVGLGVAALGALILGSELTDWILLSERRIPKTPIVERIDLGEVACKERPAGSVELSLSPPPTSDGGGHRINFRADEKGLAVFDIFSSPMMDYGFSAPFAFLTCEHCEATPVELPKELSAAIVIAGHQEVDLDAWMEAYPDAEDPAAQPVLAALKAATDREAEIRRINPERERKASQEHLWAGRVMHARTSAARCLLKAPRHQGCKKLLRQIDGLVLADMVDRAKQYIRWQVPQRALLVLGECLEMRPRHRPCAKLKKQAGRLWSKAKRGVSYRVRRVEKRMKTTTIVTEVKSRNDYANLRVSVAVYQGDEPVCLMSHTVGGIARQETIAFEVACESAIDDVDRVVLRVEGTGV
jgi:hypothetical protein